MTAIRSLFILLCSCILAMFAITASAEPSVNISQAWVRATAPGQSVGAAYMTLQSAVDSSLVKIESTAADSVEIHSMNMKNGVMQMRMMESLPLPAGKPARLEPGGFHLMLFDLKKPLKAGEQVDFVLHFKDIAGKTSRTSISVPIKTGAN